MNRYYYDLHMHSCLSPCADDDMTPANMAGMASLNGLQLVALTDHNSCGNCEAFLKACRTYGIVGVPGMELTTSEEVHMVCLFPTLETALAFQDIVKQNRRPIKNKPEIFGNQLYMDAEDNVLGTEPTLLIPAGNLSIEDAYSRVIELGGACFPAHINRPSNGLLGILGAFPPSPTFPTVELNGMEDRDEYILKYCLQDRIVLSSSDAHHLWDIQMAGPSLELDDEPYSSARVRQALITFLRGGR